MFHLEVPAIFFILLVVFPTCSTKYRLPDQMANFGLQNDNGRTKAASQKQMALCYFQTVSKAHPQWAGGGTH